MSKRPHNALVFYQAMCTMAWVYGDWIFPPTATHSVLSSPLKAAGVMICGSGVAVVFDLLYQVSHWTLALTAVAPAMPEHTPNRVNPTGIICKLLARRTVTLLSLSLLCS